MAEEPERKLLTRSDIIGRKIIAVYERDVGRVQRFQTTLTYVQLDTGILFVLDEIHDLEKGALVKLHCRELEETMKPVLSIELDPNLNSPGTN